MAVGIRLNPEHDARTRAKIQTSQLINRLQTNALADAEVMTSGQIKSAEILLRKTLPDLSAVQVSGDPENPLHVGSNALDRLAEVLARLGPAQPG